MSTITDRINLVMKREYMTCRAFSAKIGMNSQTVNNYMNGKRDPTYEFLSRILETFVDISAEWLMRGEGSMIKEQDTSLEELKQVVNAMKVDMLVKEGVIKELKDILVEKCDVKVIPSRKSLIG